jgi:hypothetical protein
MTIYNPQTREESELRFSAITIQNQFEALECHLNKSNICSQISELEFFQNIRCSSNFNESEVKKKLLNAWNTERLINITVRDFKGSSLLYSVQWGFPQLYYSIFSLVWTFFLVKGYTEITHTSIIKKFGKLLNEGKYPDIISFRATGGIKEIEIINLSEVRGYESINFSRSDSNTVQNQLCQFLRATRKNDLKNRKSKIKIKLANNQGNKTKYSRDDWKKVSQSLGFTSILSLIYRRRIKSNYKDIDSYLSDDLDASKLYKSIIHICETINFIHEVYIAKAIGLSKYREFVQETDFIFVNKRLTKIIEMI